MSVCGTPNCRCKKDPAQRHGPYYYWSRRKGGRLVQKVLSGSQAKTIARGIRNYRTIREILRNWEEQTLRIVATYRSPNR